VKTLPDLFDLTKEQLLAVKRELPDGSKRGFADTSAENLLGAIRKGANAELPRFLYGSASPRWASRWRSTWRGTSAPSPRCGPRIQEALQRVPGVGPRMAEQIVTFFAEPKNAEMLDRLLAGA
jgi:DNA ligase (NAD+)